MSNVLKARIKQQADRRIEAIRLARENLLKFTLYTWPEFQVNWHHHVLSDYLTAFAKGEIKRLMVLAPPRHGKSEMVSRRLPAFLLGRNPDAEIAIASYSASLANDMNRDCQSILESEPYKRLFKETRISEGRMSGWKRTQDTAEIVDRKGVLRSVGRGGPLTGKGFDFGIADDLLKDAAEADSFTVRENAWKWYQSVFATRASKGAGILMTMTRWHRDDPGGRLLAEMQGERGEKWEVIKIPAIAEDEIAPYDPRRPGEPLWPWKLSLEELLARKQQSPRTFSALYQQDPQAEGGAEWPAECFGEFLWVERNQVPWKDIRLSIVALDPSKGKDAHTSDYSAMVWIGITPGLVYVDCDLQRRNPSRIIDDLWPWCERYKPQHLAIESNQFQELLWPLIIEQSRKNNRQGTHLTTMIVRGDPLHAVNNTLKKEFRIRRLSRYITNREFRFIRSPGSQICLDQLRDFPNGDHDDGPDALEMAVSLVHELYDA